MREEGAFERTLDFDSFLGDDGVCCFLGGL